MHKSFKKVLDILIRLHKKKQGDSIFWSWVKKHDLDEKLDLALQQGYIKKTDSIQNNYQQIMKSVKTTLEAQKSGLGIVTDKYIQETFNQAVLDAARELSVEAKSFVDFSKPNSTVKILQDNAKIVNFELYDAIAKEISLFVSGLAANDIPVSNSALRQEISGIFQKKQGRLNSQARTETTRSASSGIRYGYQQSGIVVAKQWVAIIDGKTSGICLTGNGEIREIGEPFGDGLFGAPHHVNCRSGEQAIKAEAVP